MIPQTRSSLQYGAVLPLVAIGLVAIIGMVGLALDMGHAYVNKNRLQGAVDAAALSGAKVLDMTKDTAAADDAARDTFTLDAGGPGNAELSAGVNAADLVLEFSPTLIPWSPGAPDPSYVRASINSFTLNAWFIRVLGFVNKTVAASAVAGPSPALSCVSNIVPIVLCGDESIGPELYGYTVGQIYRLRLSAGEAGEPGVGDGNYQLLDLGCDSGGGGSCVRENMAGAFENCVDDIETVETKPGLTGGPSVQGLNTRFGEYSGGLDPARYPPDWVTDQPLTYAQYLGAYDALGSSIDSDYARVRRRVVVVPIGKCGTAESGGGVSDVPVLGFGCFFLTEKAQMGGQNEISGEFTGACSAAGVSGPNPATGPAYKIQLYKDPGVDDA